MKRIYLAIFFATLLISSPASAYDAVVAARVTMIEPTYMPSQIVFTADAGTSACPPGHLLQWAARGATLPEQIANSQAVISLLATAKASGSQVTLYIKNADCSAEFIHF